MSSSTKKKSDFNEFIDIILKYTNANDVKNILSRIKSTSKTNYTRNYGDEIKVINTYYTNFISNKTTILTPIKITDKSEIDKITYKTIPINKIINNIIRNNFIFIIDNDRNKSYIRYNKGYFYFEAFNLNDEKYYDKDGDGYFKCSCIFKIDDTSKHNFIYRIANSNSIDKDIKDLSDDEFIHINNTNYSKTFAYMYSDNSNKKFSISAFKYVNSNNAFIELTPHYE